MFEKFVPWLGQDIAIDLGTANTLIFAKGHGLVLNEPSVVTFHEVTGKVEAVGKTARAMLARTPHSMRTVQPLKDGVVANLTATEHMLSHFLKSIRKYCGQFGVRALVGVTSDATPVESRAIIHAALRAGCKSVRLVPEPLAAAIGAGLAVAEPMGRMIVDIGSGVTDIAVISLSDIVLSQTLRTAGSQLDAAIMQHVRHEHLLLIGEPTAEHIKMKIGSAMPLSTPRSLEITGRSLTDGLPRTVKLHDAEIRQAITPVVDQIMMAVRKALDKVPPEVSADLTEQGIVLTGGMAYLKGLTERLSLETRLPVQVAPEPMLSVVYGVSQMLEVAAQTDGPTMPWTLRPSEG
ncbi:MAG: rod shape-determining protein [Blastocatellia bacterium]|nr:rod shape-determining protein [Blastocatellia bacterium]